MEGLLRMGFGFEIAGDIDVDYATRVDVWREEDGRELDNAFVIGQENSCLRMSELASTFIDFADFVRREDFSYQHQRRLCQRSAR